VLFDAEVFASKYSSDVGVALFVQQHGAQYEPLSSMLAGRALSWTSSRAGQFAFLPFSTITSQIAADNDAHVQVRRAERK